MTALHIHRMSLMIGRLSLSITIAMSLSTSALAESRPGEPARRHRHVKKKVQPERRHDPTALDRRLMPAPDFDSSATPVGGLMVDKAHWNPFDPKARKQFTVNGGSSAGLRKGDHLLVWRGLHQTIVAEVEVVHVAEDNAQVRVVRRPDQSKVLPLELQAVMTGDRVSLLLRADSGIWPKAKKKKRRRRIVRKASANDSQRRAAEPQAVPPGKDTIVIGGRELPKATAKGVPLTAAQLPEFKQGAKDKASK